MSIESYVMWLIRENGLENSFLKLKYKNFNNEVALLKINNIIDESKEKTLMYVYKNIKFFRHDIVHCNNSSYYIEEDKAFKTIGLIQAFYEKYEKGKNI